MARSGDCQASPECAQELAAGVSDYQQRSYDTAQAHFEKAFAQSSDVRVLVLLGRTFFKRGDSRGALQFYERARPQITLAADRAKLEQYIAEARASTGSPASQPGPETTPDLTPRPEPSGTAGQVDLSSSAPPPPPPPPPVKEKRMKPWMWALVGVTAAAVVGTAVGLGVYYGSAAPTPDSTVHFP
jgi:hypothetical protein